MQTRLFGSVILGGKRVKSTSTNSSHPFLPVWWAILKFVECPARLENMQVSADVSVRADWENKRLINMTIGQTIGEVRVSLRLGTSFPTWVPCDIDMPEKMPINPGYITSEVSAAD